MSRERKIPKSAVKPLVEYCKKLGEETGRPAAEILKEHLELMKRYGDFFFARPWPEERDKQLGFRDEEMEFIGEGESFEESCERCTVVCLRRNISMEGFDSEGFTEDFRFYGGWECHDCSVPEAMDLREKVEQLEKLRREVQEEMELEEPSWFAKEMSEHFRKPDVVKADKMWLVRLRLYEEVGGAEGKSCEVKNRYKCPYGEVSKQLIEDGGFVEFLWREIEWYDRHWNPPYGFRSSSQDAKWYHFDEPGIVDVTSFEDVLKAIGDGRLEKIIEEHERYMKETGREAWEL